MKDEETSRQPDDFLPLRPVEFQVLLSLSRGDRHGYGIMRDATERTGRSVAPEIGTFYRALRRMKEAGLVQDSDRRPAPDADDERRNYYRITPLGRGVAEAEAGRMEALLRDAREGGLLREPESA